MAARIILSLPSMTWVVMALSTLPRHPCPQKLSVQSLNSSPQWLWTRFSRSSAWTQRYHSTFPHFRFSLKPRARLHIPSRLFTFLKPTVVVQKKPDSSMGNHWPTFCFSNSFKVRSELHCCFSANAQADIRSKDCVPGLQLNEDEDEDGCASVGVRPGKAWRHSPTWARYYQGAHWESFAGRSKRRLDDSGLVWFYCFNVAASAVLYCPYEYVLFVTSLLSLLRALMICASSTSWRLEPWAFGAWPKKTWSVSPRPLEPQWRSLSQIWRVKNHSTPPCLATVSFVVVFWSFLNAFAWVHFEVSLTSLSFLSPLFTSLFTCPLSVLRWLLQPRRLCRSVSAMMSSSSFTSPRCAWIAISSHNLLYFSFMMLLLSMLTVC